VNWVAERHYFVRYEQYNPYAGGAETRTATINIHPLDWLRKMQQEAVESERARELTFKMGPIRYNLVWWQDITDYVQSKRP